MDKETITKMCCDIFDRRTPRNLKKVPKLFSIASNLTEIAYIFTHDCRNTYIRFIVILSLET